MPFSFPHQCLFVHIPRTGGTTIEKLLGIHREWPALYLDVLHGALTLGNQEYQLQHLSLRDASQLLSGHLLETCFKFSVCRNPWDRLVSSFFWRDGVGGKLEFERFAQDTCELVKLRQELEGRNCHYRPQIEFLDDKLDFVGRFENFQADVTCILKRLGLSGRPIPHEFKTQHLPYREYYTERSRKLVSVTYEADIDFLKYTF